MNQSPIDLDRVRRAMKHIAVSGLPRTAERQRAIADVICAIQADGGKALASEYVGVKNYAHFGDQRSDHPYGYGPSHGSIVFRIGRADRDPSRRIVLGADEVYALECLRDFRGVTPPRAMFASVVAFAPFQTDWRYPSGDEGRELNLFDAIRLRDAAEALSKCAREAVDAALVESHEVPA
jgi:hypothetical protein